MLLTHPGCSLCKSGWRSGCTLRISNIYHYLTTDATKTFLSAFVLSKLDYCNSLLLGSPKHLDKLQKVQNSAARLVFKVCKHEHIKLLLQKLHWLPIASRILYKIATFFHCLLSIQTSSLHFWHKSLLRIFHKNKNLWATSFLFHEPDTVELKILPLDHQLHFLSIKP